LNIFKIAGFGSVEFNFRILGLDDPSIQESVTKVLHWSDATWLSPQNWRFSVFGIL